MAVQFSLDARGVAGIGGGVPARTDLGQWSAGSPAFWTLVLLLALLVVIVAVGHSLR